jgi:glycosyltransferase involved in cell wall biosynthesis
MTIAVNSRLLLRDKMSGIGWYSYHTLKNLTHLHPEHKFIFIFDRPFDDQFIFGSNVKPVVVYPPARHPFLYYIWFNYSIVPFIHKYKADVFFSPDGFLSLNLPKIPSVPVIHDINFQHFPMDFPYLVRKYYCHYFPKFAQIAERIITVSEFSKKDIATTYQIPLEKIDVVYNGTNEEFFVLNDDTKKEVKIQYSQGEDYFLYVGDLLPRKNVNRLIEAFDLFKQASGSSTKLLIVGERMFMTSEINQAFQNAKFRNEIIFTGRLPQHELVKVVGAAKAMVYVSLFEGFGLPIVEAMKANVPVITSNVTSMPEIAGDAAIIVDPYSIESIKNALLEIDKDELLRKSLIEKGNIQYTKFTWLNTAKGVWDSLEKAINRERGEHF